MATLQQAAHLATIPLTVEITLDCGLMPLRRVFDLEAGSVIRSQRPAGDNLDIRIGGKVIAYGEIVPLEGMTGVRIAHIVESQ
jgi:flagellar motor switch protein FliN/FliY